MENEVYSDANNSEKLKINFNSILKLCDIKNFSCTGYLIKNDNCKKIKIFPKEITELVPKNYCKNLNYITKNYEFVNYLPDEKDKNFLQVIETNKLKLWDDMKTAVNNFSITNNEEIYVSDYNDDGNTIIFKINNDTAEPIYILTYHRKIEKWFRNGYKFFKNKQTKKFEEEKGFILAFNSSCGVVIYKKQCFIINEYMFNKIFKYDEKIEKDLIKSKDEILKINFLSDTNMFYELIMENNQQKKNMSRIIAQERLNEIKKLSAKDIKESLSARNELKEVLKFDKENKIIVNKISFKIIMDVLRGKIAIDILTKKTLKNGKTL